MEELCGATSTGDACTLLARKVGRSSGASFVAIFLLNFEGRTLVLVEPHKHANGQSIEIQIGNLEDPLCYCVQSGQPVYYTLKVGILPESINRFTEQMQRVYRSVIMHPLIAPGKKVIGVLVCFFEESSRTDVQLGAICLYGSAIIARFQEKAYVEQLVQNYENDISLISSKNNSQNIPSDEIVGISESIRSIKNIVIKSANTDVPILITGDTGTGKSLIAKVIHKYSNRCNGPFTEINCGAIPESLLESELFGHRKGSFSGATSDYPGLFRSADGGIVFLDEIGEMPVNLQSVLLHVLQEHKVRPVGSTEVFPVNVRIVAATNKNIEKAMQEGFFRRDLYHRLAVVRLAIPSLAERKEDIIPLARMFFKHFCQKHQKNTLKISQRFIEYLLSRNYEGNIRELSYIIERSVMLSEGIELDISFENRASNARMPFLHLDKYISTKEKEFIESCFLLCGNDLNLCATVLGVHQKTLLRRLRKYGMNG
jgi:Nif-specific regulatory protein